MANPTSDALTDAQIEDRALILYGCDQATCEGCDTPAPNEAAADPRWFIDSKLVPNESCPDESATVAVIRCPELLVDVRRTSGSKGYRMKVAPRPPAAPAVPRTRWQTPEARPMIALGYARRSKQSGERTVSLEDQRERIETYCAERGWHPIGPTPSSRGKLNVRPRGVVL